MKRFTVLGLIICLIGCTTLQPATGNPATLQQRIASGELLKRGDDVDILTKDGRTHDFSVKSVSAGTIDGPHESISIDQVAVVQKRKLNVGKTMLAVGLSVVVVAAVVAIAVCSGGRHGAGQAATGLEVPPTTLNHRLRHHCQSFRLLPKHRSFRLAPDPGARAKPKRRAADTARLLALVPNLEPLGPFI